MSKQLELKKIKKFAKELYMVPGKNGRHKHNNPDIVEKIKQKFHKEYSRYTIAKWAKDLDENGSNWLKEYRASIALGISGADIKKASRDGMIPEEVVENEIVKKIRETTEQNEKMNKGASQALMTWVAIKNQQLKALVDSHKKNNTNITNEEFESIISARDRDFFLQIKRDTYGVLKELREAGDIGYKSPTDRLIEKFCAMDDAKLARFIEDKSILPLGVEEE